MHEIKPFNARKPTIEKPLTIYIFYTILYLILIENSICFEEFCLSIFYFIQLLGNQRWVTYRFWLWITTKYPSFIAWTIYTWNTLFNCEHMNILVLSLTNRWAHQNSWLSERQFVRH